MQIRPSADLRNHYSEISRQCRESREPVIITVNGRGDTAILGLEEYEQLIAELKLLRMLAESEEDVSDNRVKPAEDVFAELKADLEARYK